MKTKERQLAEMLYRAIKELDYVRLSSPRCGSGLCATSDGAALVEEGMALLGVKDLATEDLPCDHFWRTVERGGKWVTECETCPAIREQP